MASENVNIQGLDKAELLAALYSRAQVLGMGRLQAKPGDLTSDEARDLIAKHSYVGNRHISDRFCPPNTPPTTIRFDYLHGRVMKVELAGDTLDTYLYNRDNGAGAAEAIVAALRAKTEIPGQPTVVPPPPEDPEAFANEQMGQIQIVSFSSLDDFLGGAKK